MLRICLIVILYLGNENDYLFFYKSNIALYYTGLNKIIGTDVISSGIPLPDDISLSDNLLFFYNTYSGGYCMAYTSNNTSYFDYQGSSYHYIYAFTPDGSKASFDYYTISGNTITLASSNITSLRTKAANTYYQKFLATQNDMPTVGYTGLDNFFKNNNIVNLSSSVSSDYIFPYIADEDSILCDLSDYDEIYIFPGSLTHEFLPIKFSVVHVTDYSTEILYSISLDTSSDYYNSIVTNPSDYWFELDTSNFKDLLSYNERYLFVLSGNNQFDEYSITREILYGSSVYIPSESEKQTDAINNQTEILEEQTEILKEQTETSKGIWETLKEVVSYINPASENFFVYKLIDLLVDALKSLFIPEDGFLSSYFDELFDWFCDRLGFLSYPLELILDILNKILDIDFSEPIIYIPDINEPVTGQLLFSETSYNLNSLLENETLKNVHDIYLIIIDAVIVFGFVNLLKKKMEEVTTL